MQDFEEEAERRFVAAVGRGGHQDDMPLLVLSEAPDELVPLLPCTSLIAGGAGVRLVDDHKLRTGAREIFSSAVALDVVQRNDRKSHTLKQRFADAETQ